MERCTSIKDNKFLPTIRLRSNGRLRKLSGSDVSLFACASMVERLGMASIHSAPLAEAFDAEIPPRAIMSVPALVVEEAVSRTSSPSAFKTSLLVEDKSPLGVDVALVMSSLCSPPMDWRTRDRACEHVGLKVEFCHYYYC